jgi:hypothetical protein
MAVKSNFYYGFWRELGGTGNVLAGPKTKQRNKINNIIITNNNNNKKR